LPSKVAEIGLSKRGELSFQWAQRHMKTLERIKIKNQKKQPLAGYNLGLCLHITKETSVLLMAAKELGAEIAVCSANPLSTQDDIAAFLSSQGVNTYAWRGQTNQEFKETLHSVLEFNPNIVTDDGAELHVLANSRKIKNILGGTEETTSGINRLKVLEMTNKLVYPVIAVNDAYSKRLFDNRYGTGQSTVDGLMRATGIFLAGKNVVVCGYGWVGKGVASRARGLGSIVTITEVDYIRALEAHMDGFAVKKLSDVAHIGDIFITCTGQTKVIRKEHMKKMKSGAILCNAGHFDVEIDINYLYQEDQKPISLRADVDCFTFCNKKIILLAKGRVVNLVSAEGHPPEVMDLSFSNQLLSIIFITKNHGKLNSRIYKVPCDIDYNVAKYSLYAMNIKIDKLTHLQEVYKNSV